MNRIFKRGLGDLTEVNEPPGGLNPLALKSEYVVDLEYGTPKSIYEDVLEYWIRSNIRQVSKWLPWEVNMSDEELLLFRLTFAEYIKANTIQIGRLVRSPNDVEGSFCVDVDDKGVWKDYV